MVSSSFFIAYALLLAFYINMSTSLYNRGQVLGLWYTNKRILNPTITSTGSSSQSDKTASITATDLVKNLKITIEKIKLSGISEDGMKVDYTKIKASQAYQQYRHLVSALQEINLSSLTSYEKKALFINTYNCLTIHALIEGLLASFPGGLLSRLQLYASASYIIDHIPYSLNDIENGILRGNRKAPSPLSALPFSLKDDARLANCLDCDPRIHFALNCGAVSCPPISVYSPIEASLDYQLNTAAIGFIEQSCHLDVAKRKLRVSKIFDWYREDFGGSDDQVIDWIKSHSNKLFEGISIPTADLQLEYDMYNWSLNK
jgi:hypothetical protein